MTTEVAPQRRHARSEGSPGAPRVTWLHLPLAVFGISMIFPLVWMLTTSLKTPGEQLRFPPDLLPHPVTLDNYRRLLASIPVGRYFYNTMEITVLSVAGSLASSALAGYAFARLRFRGDTALFAVLMATLLIPGQVTLVPTFVLMHWLGWIDSHAALIVPNLFGSAFSVFLFRQFYRSIPQELVDAALIDGAGYLRIFWSIFLPLSKPVLATVAVLTALGSWNDLLGPLIFLNSENKMTLTQGVTALAGKPGTNTSPWGILMGGALTILLPLLALYVVAQRYFVEGLSRTGLKG